MTRLGGEVTLQFGSAGVHTDTMLVFVDESGDPGFKLERGSTPIFAAAMVIFDGADAARGTADVIRETAGRLGTSREFRFNKCNERARDTFFRAVSICPFIVRAIVVRKALIYSPHLMMDKEDFYRFFVRQMMTHDGGLLEGARIVIDGSGDRKFRRMLNVYTCSNGRT